MELTIINSVRTNNFNDDRLVEKIAGLWKEASIQPGSDNLWCVS